MAEQVIMEVSASLKGAGGLGVGKLRVTDERLVFERKTMTRRQGDVTSFPLSTIQSAKWKGMSQTLTVRAGSTELVFSPGLSESGGAKLKAVNDLLQRAIASTPLRSPEPTPGHVPSPATTPADRPPSPASPSGIAASSSTGWIAELRDLGELHRQGVLNDAEFTAAKAKLRG